VQRLFAVSRRKDKGRIEGPFVPMLIQTTSCRAWRAMSPYARIVYMALKSRYGPGIKNNGRLYMSARDGAEETGFNIKTVARSLRELQHYGFTVMTKAGCLGVEGKGVAPHWRLTELGYMHEPPTRDFQTGMASCSTSRKLPPIISVGNARYLDFEPAPKNRIPYRATEQTVPPSGT
jgi:hypothetical protein